MTPAATIYKNRGRLLKNRGGSWTLVFNVVDVGRGQARRTGYTQLRGKRDDLIAHAKKLGIEDVFIPEHTGTVPIDYAANWIDTNDKNAAKFAGISDADLEAQWWDTKSFVSEACEIEHCTIEDELDRRKAITTLQQETSQ